jgi:hypothetical protein
LRWSHVLAHQERYDDLRAEADRELLTTGPQPAAENCTRVDAELRAWLGWRLVVLGCRLQMQEANPSGLCADVLGGQTESTLACCDC